MPRQTKSLISIDPTSGCWLWQGATDAYGRPLTYDKGRPVRVQHLYFQRKHGYKPSLVVLSCHALRLGQANEFSCVNPDHIKDKSNSAQYREYLEHALSTELDAVSKAELVLELEKLKRRSTPKGAH